jgi:MFS family permease
MNPSREAGAWVWIPLTTLVLGLLYLLGRMTANSLGVIAGDLEVSLNLSATQTAALAGGTYLAYGVAQIPGSLLLARIGPRRLTPIAGAALALFVYGFSIAPNYWALLMTRVAIGVALAPLLPGALAICIELAGEGSFAILSGALISLGRLGVVAATLPFAALIAVIGEHGSFVWLASGCFLASAVVAAFLALGPRGGVEKAQPRVKFLEVAGLLKAPELIAAIAFLGANLAAVNAILGFWGAPWLSNVYDMGLSERSLVMLSLALSWALGALAWGLVPRLRMPPLTPILIAAAVAALCLAAAAFLPLGREWLALWFVVLGLATASYPTVLSLVKASTPKAATVHTVALVSMGSMIGVFVGQMASGLILDVFPGAPGQHPTEAYSTLFAVFALVIALTGGLFWRVQVKRAKRGPAQAPSNSAVDK